jgi:hypothetical protein
MIFIGLGGHSDDEQENEDERSLNRNPSISNVVHMSFSAAMEAYQDQGEDEEFDNPSYYVRPYRRRLRRYLEANYDEEDLDYGTRIKGLESYPLPKIIEKDEPSLKPLDQSDKNYIEKLEEMAFLFFKGKKKRNKNYHVFLFEIKK